MHVPVLLNEVLGYLDPKPNENFIDCTFGEGGHTEAILRKTAPSGKVLGIETDAALCEKVKNSVRGLSGRLILVNDSYANLKRIVEERNFRPVSGILLDLGLSSWHLLLSGRGFTFQKNEPLNMLFRQEGRGADEIVNHWEENEIEKILKEYGEEKFAGAIAGKIAEKRKKKKIETTFELVEIIKEAVPKRFHYKKHPATKTFQALRIAANNELENIRLVLPQAMEILEKKGRLAVISFHSLEDRIVKRFFRENKNSGRVRLLSKKPIVPGPDEILKNLSSRSAKLRVVIKN